MVAVLGANFYIWSAMTGSAEGFNLRRGHLARRFGLVVLVCVVSVTRLDHI